MLYTQTFEDIGKANVNIAGGKGASLGEMTQAGIPVPPGFVVTAQTFDEFLKITDLNVELDAILDQVNHEVMHEVDDASEKIKALILGKEIPPAMAEAITAAWKKLDAKFVAVRSSATAEDSAAAAWAGQLDTYLNTTEQDLLENVQKCWASLFTPRAIFYRFEKGLHGTPISVAVVVQKMIQSEVSGIAFSVHPVTQDYDQLIIEAGFGLGEAIVSGSITPDSYVVEKSDWRIIDKNITTQERGIFCKDAGGNEWKNIPEEQGELPTLSDEEVIELAQLIVKIEQHYGFPVDVEWALLRQGSVGQGTRKGEFYIVQSRPITTLSSKTELKPVNKEAEYVFMWNSNLLMPVYWASPTALQERSDVWRDLDTFSYFDGALITTYMVKSQLEEMKGKDSLRYLDPEYFKQYQDKYRTETKHWWKWIRKTEKKDYSQTNSDELVVDHQQFSDYQRDSIVYFGSTRPENTYAVERRLEEILKKHAKKEWAEVFGILATDTAYDNIQQEELDWIQLLQKNPNNEHILNHVSKYPWLVVEEFDERKVIDHMRGRMEEFADKTYEEALKTQEDKKKKLKEKQKEVLDGLGGQEKEACYLVSFLQAQSTERMNIKAYWAGSYYLARNMWRAIANVTGLSVMDLITYVTPLEIQEILSGRHQGDIRKKITTRKKSLAIVHERGRGVQVIAGAEADALFKKNIKAAPKDIKTITGQTASLGVYRGKVCKVVAGDLEALKGSIRDFQQGEVLVTSMTQPNMMTVAKRAGAIVADEGGITSHAAIISRELGIPCVVGCLYAMQVLNDGDEVEVDAENGVVKIIKKADGKS